MSFFDTLKQYDWDSIKESIYSKTDQDVQLALNKSSCTLDDFKALISPAAAPYLEQMAQKSMDLN